MASFRRTQRAVGVLLLAVALALLAGTLFLSFSTLSQSRALEDKVNLTDGIVNANVRTLSQVQRELLRLEVMLTQGPPQRSALVVQGQLVTQRIQEGTLSYQGKTLGAESLLDRSKKLRSRWLAEGRPLLRDAAEAGPQGEAARQQLVALARDLELDYNQLVSEGENNRKIMAGQANAETKVLLARARLLLVGLLATFFAIGLYFALAGLVYRALHRQRERASSDLVALNQELLKHAHVVRETDNMVVITDAAGLIEWVNAAFERTTGWRLDEVVGRSPGALLQGPDTDPETVRRMSRSLAQGLGFSEEVLNYTRDGRAYWNNVETTPIRTDSGTLTGFVSVQSDITERRRGEELLRAAKEAAEATASEKSNFLASMSHEIRTPLNAVLGFTDLLLLTPLDTQQREYVRTAHSSGRLLLELINDILDFSALEAGRIEPERRAFDLAALVDETMGMFEPEARRRGLDLQAEVDSAVPTLVWGDETRLRQVLVNLVGNAVKFTDSGSVRLQARPGPEGDDPSEPGSMVSFSVTDTGVGMAEDQLPRLFQPFTQGDASTTRRFGGTGLGLAICRLLTQRMGGQIDVRSRQGEGSTFTVTLPLAPAARADVTEEPTPQDGPDVSSLRVLLAEDDAVNQTVAVHMLRRLGITPDVVADGRAAVAAAAATAYDVILMDVHMPHMDGVEATAAIRAAGGEGSPRIVAVTANALDGDRERLLCAGLDDYLSKPLQLSALASLLGRTLAEPARWADDEASATPVDEPRFAAQSGIDDPTFLDELLGHLLPQVDELAAVAPGLVAAGTLEEVRARAHTVSGAAASCAATPLAAAAAALESACSVGDAGAARLALDRVEACRASLREWMAQRLPAGSGSA